jgi:hypothetical protein
MNFSVQYVAVMVLDFYHGINIVFWFWVFFLHGVRGGVTEENLKTSGCQLTDYMSHYRFG